MRSRAKCLCKHGKDNARHPQGWPERAREARQPCEIALPRNGILQIRPFFSNLLDLQGGDFSPGRRSGSWA